MWNALLVGALALVSAQSPTTDTTFAVPRDARIEIENFDGSVDVRTWDRDAVRVAAEHSGRTRIVVRRIGAVVRIESAQRGGPARGVDYTVTVPAGAGVRITGPFTDVSVDGAGGDVLVETVRGDVSVRGGNGLVELRSVEGGITLDGARGSVTLGAVNEGIRARDVTGDLSVETVNGDVVLERIDSDNVVASTVNGDITYDGTIRDDGRYSLRTHNGDIALGVPDRANATVWIATFNGGVDSDLPITLTELRRDRRFRFVLGQGTARIELDSFNGTIRLRRTARR